MASAATYSKRSIGPALGLALAGQIEQVYLHSLQLRVQSARAAPLSEGVWGTVRRRDGELLRGHVRPLRRQCCPRD